MQLCRSCSIKGIVATGVMLGVYVVLPATATFCAAAA